jgi:hypothetical protein
MTAQNPLEFLDEITTECSIYCSLCETKETMKLLYDEHPGNFAEHLIANAWVMYKDDPYCPKCAKKIKKGKKNEFN